MSWPFTSGGQSIQASASVSHLYMITGKIIDLTVWTFVGKVMPLLFNTLSVFLIAFLPRSKSLTLHSPMDCGLPGSSVHGIFQAGMLEWVAFPHSSGSFLIRGLKLRLLCLPHWQAIHLSLESPGKPLTE